jgi:hypothetical protein
MTEAEWRACKDHREMMYFLRGKAGVRKLQLFACACCRRAPYRHQVHPIEMLEGYADRRVKRKDAMAAVKAAVRGGGINAYCEWLFWRAKCHQGADIASAFCVDEAEGATLLRDIFGPLPFRPVAADPAWMSWNGGAVIKLAQAAYDERHLPAGTLDNARLAVLADALEESGCTEETILGHLRGGSEHYRGCFVVDALLGKE